MLNTSATESIESLQGGFSQPLTNGELFADEFKTLEFINNDFLHFVKIQKAPGDRMNSPEKS